MLIATKYEEIYPPLLKDFVFVSDNTCSAEQILSMEKKILVTIDFDLQLTSSYRFLERFSKLAGIDPVCFHLSCYMLEVGLLDSKMNQFSTSLQAVSAIYLAKKYLKLHNGSSGEVQAILPEYELTTFTTDQVKSCAKCLNQLAQLVQNSKLQMLIHKYRHSKYYEVGRIVANVNKMSAKR